MLESDNYGTQSFMELHSQLNEEYFFHSSSESSREIVDCIRHFDQTDSERTVNKTKSVWYICCLINRTAFSESGIAALDH